MDKITIDPGIGAVVCGLDRFFNYYKVLYAYRCLETIPGCLFVATNLDSTYPSTHFNYPGGGATTSPLITATGRQPDFVCGKPNTFLLDLLINT